MWKSLSTLGSIGSENGVIVADEEYEAACRITLEKCKMYYAITCGVYGSMVHTVFSDSDHYEETYAAMKKDLEEFIDKETTYSEEIEFYSRFTAKY